MIQISENINLSAFSTIGIGGAAQYLCRPNSVDDLRGGLHWAKSRQLSVLLLGSGSNLLISDNGFSGLVIKLAMRGIHWEGTTAIVAAGESWNDFVQDTVARGLSGVECLAGIPGTVGATPMQNVGAYGQEVAHTIVQVDLLNRETGAEESFDNHACQFGYRTSRFKTVDNEKYVITRVHFKLSKGPATLPTYPELRSKVVAHAAWLGASASDKLQIIRDEVLTLRQAKGMVVDSRDPDSKSLGSFFTNPIVTAAERDEVEKRRIALLIPKSLPQFTQEDGRVKLSAAWLIEQSGITKGLTHKGAAVSSKHTLALINKHQATAADILALADLIRKKVYAQFGLQLEQEPLYVGP